MLHENCLLVNLRITMPPQTKLAREASEDVEVKYQTAKRQGKVTKQLFHPTDIQPLQQVMSRARTLFNEISLPYDSAYRIIPSSKYFDFVEKMGQVSREFNEKKDDFLANYNNAMKKAGIALGGLFNPDDYPDPIALNHHINLTIESSVVPPLTAFDELAGVTPEAIDELKRQAISAQEDKIKQAMEDLVMRLHTSLNKAKSKLSDEDSIFRDTLVGNIHDALEAVDNLNLTEDPKIIALAHEVRVMMEGITPDVLRRNMELRKQTVENTENILKRMSEFF